METSLTKLAVRYAVAGGSAAAAFALAMTLEHPWVNLSPFFLFYAAVAISSWYGGTGPGLLATALGALAVDYYILEPRGALGVVHPQDLPRLVLFASVGVLIATLNGALLRAQYRVQLHQQRLEAMASELMMAEERERRRIATVLHDAVVQTLALSKLKVDALRRTTNDGVHERLTEIYGLIDESIGRTRTLTAELSPPVLYELGLPPAIQWLGDRLRDDHGISFELDAPKEWTTLHDEARVVMFQAVRELLVNVAKHAKATKCRVYVSRDERAVTVAVEDDGVGFTPTRSTDYTTGGFGLFNIRQRLEYLGGSCTLAARPGGGTTVTLVTPLQQSHAKAGT